MGRRAAGGRSSRRPRRARAGRRGGSVHRALPSARSSPPFSPSSATTAPSSATCSARSATTELDRFLDAEHAAWRPARSLVDSAHALLDSLRGRGLRLAVVANTWPDPPRLVRRELDELGVAERVDAIVLSGEVGARKPEPAIFERALEELGVAAAAALFVGDRLVDDVQGAAAAGMRTVQALWFRADDGADGVEPDFLAFTPVDVLNVARRLAN